MSGQDVEIELFRQGVSCAALLERSCGKDGALRAEVSGHDVSVQSRDKGRFTKSVGVEIGKLASAATA